MTVPVERTPLASSDVDAVQLAPDGFHVWYRGGREYVYQGVDAAGAEAAAESASPGRFIRAMVAGLSFERVV